MEKVEFKSILGCVFTRIEGGVVGGESISFIDDKNKLKYELVHEQDCCESVLIEDIEGDLNDLIGSEILQSGEIISRMEENAKDYDSCTWTFYKIATVKGYVTIRFFGESNGYYSEEVDLFLSKLIG